MGIINSKGIIGQLYFIHGMNEITEVLDPVRTLSICEDSIYGECWYYLSRQANQNKQGSNLKWQLGDPYN